MLNKNWSKTKQTNYLKASEFFPNVKMESNQYFVAERVIDEDTIVIITKDIIVNPYKQTILFLVDNNKAVYLKPQNVKYVSNYFNGLNGYAVRLNRNFFKVYTFKNDFEGFSFDNESTFDELVEIAKSQEKEELKITIESFDFVDFMPNN